MPHLLSHRASVYSCNGLLRGPATLIPIAECLAVELSQPVFRLRSAGLGFEDPTFRLRGQRSNLLRHRRGFKYADVKLYTINLILLNIRNILHKKCDAI